MNKGDILTLTISSVRFHKEERMQQDATYGIYASNYVASFKEYPRGIVVVDTLAARMHPDWDRKTESRANQLSTELRNKQVKVRVSMVLFGKDAFEAELI